MEAQFIRGPSFFKLAPQNASNVQWCFAALAERDEAASETCTCIVTAGPAFHAAQDLSNSVQLPCSAELKSEIALNIRAMSRALCLSWSKV